MFRLEERCCRGLGVTMEAVVLVLMLVVVIAVLTVGGESFWAVGETDNVPVSFQDEDLVVTTRH